MAKQEVVFDYFHGYESEQFAFYQIPKVLFTDDYFRGLSSDAKVLYGLMLDRMALSLKNNWIDNEGRVYIIFTLEQIMQCLNCGKDKGVKILAELDTNKGIGLIERVKRGLGKPSIIYVKSFLIKDRLSDQNVSEAKQNGQEAVRNSEFRKAEVKSSEKPKSGLLEDRNQDFGKSNSINTEYNQTDFNKTDLINLSGNHSGEKPGEQIKNRYKKRDGMSVIGAYTAIIKENIHYDSLVNRYTPDDRRYVDEMVELMVEVVGVERKKIYIAGTEYPYEFVKERMLKVEDCHIQYVIECMHENTTKIHNVKSYILTCLFNAPSTIDSYYLSEVNHDLYKIPYFP